jgi:hypothetical protein
MNHMVLAWPLRRRQSHPGRNLQENLNMDVVSYLYGPMPRTGLVQKPAKVEGETRLVAVDVLPGGLPSIRCQVARSCRRWTAACRLRQFNNASSDRPLPTCEELHAAKLSQAVSGLVRS